MKTVLLELRPVHRKSDDRITAHIFIVMLAYYLQWHFMQRVAPLFANDGKGSERRWSFDIIKGSIVDSNFAVLFVPS